MKVLTFGELLLRLKSEGNYRLLQTQNLEATFGGGEANVAVSLANYGIESEFFTALPDNRIGDAAVSEIRKYGVDTKNILRRPGRMGIYFLEEGSCQRPSRVIYDRDYTSISMLDAEETDWDKLFDGIEWFHISGITPAINQNLANITIEAVKIAASKGITVSVDLNYRGKLWKYGKKPEEVMSEITRYADVLIAGREDIQKCLGIGADIKTANPDDSLNMEGFKELTEVTMKKYPNVKKTVVTLRESKSCDHNFFSACFNNGEHFYTSTCYEIKDIVDRVGTGDAFSGGLIYGLISYEDDAKALEFAAAAACLKHSIEGDINLVTVEETEELMRGSASGRVQR